MFDDTDTEVEETAATGDQLEIEVVNVDAVPAWVTVIVTVEDVPPVGVNVTIAERALVDVFTEACNVTDALPEPEVGDTCNQD